MTIFVNGEAQAHAANLAALLERMALSDAAVATAVNGCFVPRSEREQTRLNNGDHVEVLAPMQGG